MTNLISALDEIVNDHLFMDLVIENKSDESPKIANEYFEKFKEIYSSIPRHRYSDISSFVNNNLTADAADSLLIAIDYILQIAQINGYDNELENDQNFKTYTSLFKLHDHITLETQRFSSSKKIELATRAFKEEEGSIRNLIGDAKSAVSDAKERAKNLSEQLISILGIFAGIIVTFSFAVTTIGEALANLSSSNVTLLAFIICVLGIVFISTITLLMCFISKLSGHKFNSIPLWVLYGLSNLILIFLTFYFHSKI